MYYRLIKPIWGKPEINGKPNPDFTTEIKGPNTLEGEFDKKFLRERNAEGYNIYFFPNYPSKNPKDKFVRGNDIDVFEYIFVDMDLKDKVYESKEDFLKVLSNFSLKPTKVIDSGNGIHAYWKISELDRIKYMAGQFALIQHFKTDPSIWTPLQLMRVSGFTNTKNPDVPKMAKLLSEFSSQKTYTFEEVYQYLPDINEVDAAKINKHIAILNGTHVVEELPLDTEELPKKFMRVLRCSSLFYDPEEEMGDRSSGDMALCNELYSLGFPIQDALAVLFNSKKARSRTNDRLEYAQNIISKVYDDRSSYSVLNASRWLTENKDLNYGRLVHGPSYFDCQANGWRTSEMMGLIAGPGGGKTEISLAIIKEILSNSEEGICFFFTLEMPEKQVMKRFVELVKNDKKLLDRFYMIGHETSEERIGPQQIIWHVQDTCKKENKKPLAVVVDHFHALSESINMKRDPNFQLASSIVAGRGDIKTADLKNMCRIMKDVAKRLDCFLILQNQTTKEKAGECDIPLNQSAGYGGAEFEWFCDHIVTVWQPLIRIYSETDLRVTAYQYCKIREAGARDRLPKYKKALLSYDEDSRRFSSLDEHEKRLFDELQPRAIEMRKKEARREELEYTNAPIDIAKLKKQLEVRDQKKLENKKD